MANHSSARKRVRSNETKHLRNRYQLKTCKTTIKKFKQVKEKEQAETLFRTIVGMLDKMARRHVMHHNKSARTKSQLARHMQGL